MKAPETDYAVTPDGMYLAYQVVGHGPVDLVWQVEFTSNVDLEWERPLIGAFYRELASFSRLILHDRRGVGLSSRNVAPPSLETRAADLEVVLDAANSQRTALAADAESGAPNVLFAAAHPERVHSIVWTDPSARSIWTPDYPWGYQAADVEADQSVLQLWGTEAYGKAFQAQQISRGNRFSDAEASAIARGTRHACTPDVAKAITKIWYETDVRGVLPSVDVPTLILVGADNEAMVAEAEYIAGLMPQARVRPMRGETLELRDVPGWAEEIRSFIGAPRPFMGLDRVLAAVLFTDIVGSTQRLSEVGDAAWRSILAGHDELARYHVDRLGGRYVDSTGDGFFATFDGPARAVRCAVELGEALDELGIQIRAGVHTGEVELAGDEVRGIAVHVGARIAAMAGASEVLVSQTVKDLVAGSGIVFEDRGEHELKGVPDRWHLFAVEAG